MRRQYQTILKAAKGKILVPAFEVKRKRTFPTEYRKRCSELVGLGLLKNLGLKNINGNCYGTFTATKRGSRLV